MNTTKKFIDFMAYFGAAYNLKSVSKETISSRKEKVVTKFRFSIEGENHTWITMKERERENDFYKSQKRGHVKNESSSKEGTRNLINHFMIISLAQKVLYWLITWFQMWINSTNHYFHWFLLSQTTKNYSHH